MKNLKYIYALSSLFVSFFAFDYATNFADTESASTSAESSENSDSKTTQNTSSNTQVVIDDVIKTNIINSYNSALSSTHTLKLNKGILVYKNNNKPVTLDFSGLYSISSNALNSYVIDANYTYDSSKESFNIVSGSADYSTITYNNKVYLTSSSNELAGILSFPSTLDAKYPLINLNFRFSTLLNDILKLDYEDYNVYSSSIGYTFSNSNTTIKVDQNFNLLEIKSNYNDYLSYSLSFNELDSSSTSSSLAVSDSSNFVTTLKGLFNDSSFNIDYKAEIKSTLGNNLKYNGTVSNDNDSLFLSVKEFKDNNLLNQMESTYKDNNLYFKINSSSETGDIIDTEESEVVSLMDGLMSNDTQFDYSFNASLNTLINTSTFKSILNLDLSSSYIESLSKTSSLITFKINSKAFNLSEDYSIRFELELENYNLKKISIKDYKSDDDRVMNAEFKINKESNDNLFALNTESYPIYNSLLPYYKKITFIINEIKVGGNFSTSIVQKDSSKSTVLGLSCEHYDVNLGKSINNIKLEDLNVGLSDLTINYQDDTNKTSNIATALFLMDTSNNADFNLTIKSVNYKNKKFYIELEDTTTKAISKYTLEKESLSSLIEKINKLSGKEADTSDATDQVKDEVSKIKNLISGLQYNIYFLQLKKAITQNMSFASLKKYMDIDINSDGIDATFKLNNIFGGSSPLFNINNGKLSENAEVTLSLSKTDGSIVSLSVSDINMSEKNESGEVSNSTKVSKTSIGLNDFTQNKILSDTQIKEEWENTEEKPNNSKDLNTVVSKISDVVDVYGSMVKKNSILQNLISVDFAYNDTRENSKKNISLNADLSSKIHFDENANIDDMYVEGAIPLKFSSKNNSKDKTNTISSMNLQFVYSKNDLDNSHFKNYVENTNRIKAGTQIGLSLGYAGGDQSRNNSKLYAHSDTKTISSMIGSLSKISNENTLYPYEIVRSVKKYASSIASLLDSVDSSGINTVQLLKNLGITDAKSVADLLDGLKTDKSSLTATVNLGTLTGDATFNDLNVDITLEFKINENTSQVEGIDYIKLENSKSETTSNDVTISLTLNLNQSYLEGYDSENANVTKINKSEILSGFSPLNEGKANYINASNLYNLLQLGIDTTEKKYYNIKGVLNFKATGKITLGKLNIDCDSTILNDLYFDIKLNLFNDGDVTKDLYKIKGYLKVAINNSSNIANNYNNDFTEFFIEPGEKESEGTIYVFKANKADESTTTENSFLSQEEFAKEFSSTDNDYLKKYSNYALTKVHDKRAGLVLKENTPLLDQLFDTQTLAENYYKTNYLSIYDGDDELTKESVDYKPVVTRPAKNITSDNNNKKTYESHKLGIWYGPSSNQEAIEKYYNELKNDSVYKYYLDVITVNDINCTHTDETSWGITTRTYTVSLKEKTIPATYKYRIVSNINKTIDEITSPYYTYTLTNKYSYNVEMYKLDKKDFIGNMELHVDSSADSKGKVPTLIYYLLDYSQVISKDAQVDIIIDDIDLYDVIIGSICDSMQGNAGNSLPINYLSGWNIDVSKGYTNGKFTINPDEMIGVINQGSNKVVFDTGLFLDFNKIDSDNDSYEKWSFSLYQTKNGDNDYFVSLEAGSIFSLKIGIEDSSKFTFITSSGITSSSKYFIANEMKRYDTFVNNFKTNQYTKDFINSNPDKIYIYTGEIKISFVYSEECKKYSGVTFTNNSHHSGLLYDYRFFEGM